MHVEDCILQFKHQFHPTARISITPGASLVVLVEGDPKDNVIETTRNLANFFTKKQIDADIVGEDDRRCQIKISGNILPPTTRDAVCSTLAAARPSIRAGKREPVED